MRSLMLTMTRNSLLIMAVLAPGFAIPAFAQQTNTVDQQTRQQVEGVVARLAETLSKADGQGYQALYATNAIAISAFGKSTGQQIGDLEDVRKMGLAFTAKVDDVEPIFGGQGVVTTAPYTATFTNNPATRQVQGNLMLVLERDGGGWKIRISTFSRLASAAPSKQ
jgi:ketosteroid isomerase-like protein